MIHSAEVRALRDPRALPPALIVSILAHLALVAAIGTRPAPPRAAEPREADPIDVWAGTTAALPGGGDRSSDRTYDVDLGAAAPATPPAAAAAPPAPATPPAATTPSAAATPPAAAARAPAPAPPAPKAPATPRDDGVYDEPRPAPSAGRTAGAPGPERRADRMTSPATSPRAPAAPASPGDPAAPGSEGEGAGAGGEFGAEGAAAARSLGRAFTRAIPPACQADPAWGALPAGSAGTARVVIEIDGTGHIAGWKPEGEVPARAIENLVKRTVALLRSGTFAVQSGAVTAGRQTIEISAVVSDAAAPEEGAADSLAWRFQDGRGAASFTQSSGRHVEVTLRVIKTEVSPAAPPG